MAPTLLLHIVPKSRYNPTYGHLSLVWCVRYGNSLKKKNLSVKSIYRSKNDANIQSIRLSHHTNIITMVRGTTIPRRSPMLPTGDQAVKSKKKMRGLKIVAGKARSASPFKKNNKFTANDNVVIPHIAVGDDVRVEISQDGKRDEFEEGRDLYDPGEAESLSRVLNSLSRSLSLDSDSETEDEESMLSGTVDTRTVDTRTVDNDEETEDDESLGSFEAPQETMPVPDGKVFTKTVVLTNLDYGEGAGDSLVLRAQHRRIKPEKDSHIFINVRVSANNDVIVGATYCSFI